MSSLQIIEELCRICETQSVIIKAQAEALAQAGAVVELVGAIVSLLEKRDKDHQNRWNKIWAAPICQQYRRPEYDDFWRWNHDFFNAPVEDLRHIAALIGVKV